MIPHRHKQQIKSLRATGLGAAEITKQILGDDGLPLYSARAVERFIRKTEQNQIPKGDSKDA